MPHPITLGLEAAFWVALLLIVYTYAGYPLLLFIASSALEVYRSWRRLLGGNVMPAEPEPPAVSIVVAAHNEEAELPGLLACLARLEYPRERIEVVIVSDGSDDGTNALLASARGEGGWVQPVYQARQGKAAALNAGVTRASYDLLVFMDASTRPEPGTLRKLVRHFQDPTTGVVCGALRFAHTPASRDTEGAYWSYECLLRLMEGRLGATLTASGALYAVRRACFPRLEPTAWIEDFLVPMHARRAGYRVLYDPEALAWETPAGTVCGEFTRRVRLAIGSFRALGSLLGTHLDAVTSWAFLSHKLLRWSVPFLLLAALAANLALCGHEFYRLLLCLQLAAYATAGAGSLTVGPLQHSRLARGLYFFLAMNAAFLWGFVQFLSDRGQTSWQQVR